MGFRFRKSVSLGKGVRLNLGKRGMGVSLGSKGLRLGVGPYGARSSVGIPGTGISYEIRSGSGRSGTSAKATRVSDAAVIGCFVWSIGIFIYLIILFAASDVWKIIATLVVAGLIVLNLKMRRKEMEAKKKAEIARVKAQIEHEEADARQADKVRSKQLEPIKECPIQLKKNEVAYYITDAILLEDRARGPKTLGTGQFILTSRKAYFLTDTTTNSFDLGKILSIEIHDDSIEIIREGKTQNQFFVTEFPKTLATYIQKVIGLQKM